MSQPTEGTESATLLSYLSSQRKHVLGILEGLDEEALRRPVLPSGWTCLGLVHHLALDVERFWFRCVVAGERTAIAELADMPDAWQVGDEGSPNNKRGEYECLAIDWRHEGSRGDHRTGAQTLHAGV